MPPKKVYNKTTYFMAGPVLCMLYIYDFTQIFGAMLRLKYFRISFKYSQAKYTFTYLRRKEEDNKDNNFLA